MREPTLEQALLSDNTSLNEVHQELEKIWGALTDFRERKPQIFNYLCSQSKDVNLADAVQALAEALEILENS